VFGLNLNGLKNPKPEPDLFNKRVENFNPNRLTFKRVDLNPTRLNKQVKRVEFRSPINLPTHLIALLSNPKIDLFKQITTLLICSQKVHGRHLGLGC